MQQKYMRKTDIKRICAAFEEVISESRRGSAKFPCEKYFHCGDDKKNLWYICPIGQGLFHFYCYRARLEGKPHETWLEAYHAWLTLFAMTSAVAREKLGEWDEFLKLDKILCEVCDGWNHEN